VTPKHRGREVTLRGGQGKDDRGGQGKDEEGVRQVALDASSRHKKGEEGEEAKRRDGDTSLNVRRSSSKSIDHAPAMGRQSLHDGDLDDLEADSFAAWDDGLYFLAPVGDVDRNIYQEERVRQSTNEEPDTVEQQQRYNLALRESYRTSNSAIIKNEGGRVMEDPIQCEFCLKNVDGPKEMKEHLDECQLRTVMCEECEVPVKCVFLDEHMKNCPEKLRRLSSKIVDPVEQPETKLEPIACPEGVDRDLWLTAHDGKHPQLLQAFAKDKIACHFCQKPFKMSKITAHWTNCEDRTEICPRCNVEVWHSDMKEHTAQHCKLIEAEKLSGTPHVECPGCDAPVLSSLLNKHLNDHCVVIEGCASPEKTREILRVSLEDRMKAKVMSGMSSLGKFTAKIRNEAKAQVGYLKHRIDVWEVKAEEVIKHACTPRSVTHQEGSTEKLAHIWRKKYELHSPRS